MDATQDNVPSKEMLERLAELEHSQNQLRDLNTEMRELLDVEDAHMAALHSENVTLRKQVKVLEKIISETQQVEAEPCSSLLSDDLDVKRCSEKKHQKLEEESAMMKEQNKKLTAEIKKLQLRREQDMISMSKMKAELKNHEFQMEEAQLGLQRFNEVIHQKNLQLKHMEETAEEYSSIITNLRLVNQKMKNQLEDKQDEALFSAVNDLMDKNEGSFSASLSFADEMKLLVFSDKVKTSMSDSTPLTHKENEAEELLDPQSELQTQRCPGTMETDIQSTGRLLMAVFILLVVALVVSGSRAGDFDLFSINALWTTACLMLQPYWGVYYTALPPV